MLEGVKVSSSFPLSSKMSFEKGVVIPAKVRFCNNCDENICEECEKKNKKT